jgi:hypothetical protein
MSSFPSFQIPTSASQLQWKDIQTGRTAEERHSKLKRYVEDPLAGRITTALEAFFRPFTHQSPTSQDHIRVGGPVPGRTGLTAARWQDMQDGHGRIVEARTVLRRRRWRLGCG